LAERVVEREKRLQEARNRVGVGGDPMRALGALSRGLEEIYEQARRQATRIRMKALDDAVQMADRVMELSRLRDDLRARVAELGELAGIKLGVGEERPAVGTEPARAAAEGVYTGQIELEVGPLNDFAQLTQFEDAAAGVGGASEITVRRFSGGRATFSMNLADPVELLRELEERAPFDFVVRDQRSNQLILDIDDDGSEG